MRLSDLTGKIPGEDDEVLIGRQALHAFRLRFQHPRLGRWMEFEAPLPPTCSAHSRRCGNGGGEDYSTLPVDYFAISIFVFGSVFIFSMIASRSRAP